MKFKKLKTASARELVEFYVLNQETLKEDRPFKYKLGDVIGNKLLNPSKVFKK